MINHRRGHGRTWPLLSLAMLTAGSAWLAPAPAPAQPPGEPQIKMWYGLRRVDEPQPPAPPPKAVPAPPPRTGSSGSRHFSSEPGLLPSVPATSSLPLAPPPAIVHKEQAPARTEVSFADWLGSAFRTLPAPTAKPKSGPTAREQPAPVSTPVRPASFSPERREPEPAPRESSPTIVYITQPIPTPAPAPAPAPAPVVEAPKPAEPPQPSFVGGVLANMVAILGALAILLLVLVLAHVVMVRRYGRSFGPFLRVEVVAAPQPAAPQHAAPVPLPPPDLNEVLESGTHLVPPAEEEAPPLPNFEMGPTYEEEQLFKQEEERQKEAALLQHLFEQNLELRRQVKSAQPTPEPAPPPAEDVGPLLEGPCLTPINVG